MILPAAAFIDGGHDLARDEMRLVLLVSAAIGLHQFSSRLAGPQGLPLSPLVVGDYGVGRVEDMGGRPIVLLQTDRPAASVLILKGENVLDGGTAETVDALVVISHHADIVPFAGQQCRQPVLKIVGVLILIDHDVLELSGPVSPGFLIGIQQLHGIGDKIIKIHCPHGDHSLYVFDIDLSDGGVPLIAHLPVGLKIVLPGDLLILRLADLRQHGPRRKALFIDVQIFHDLFDEALAVAGIIDRKIIRISNPSGIPAQDTDAAGMERRGPDIPGSIPQHHLQTVLQFLRRLVGKGDGKDPPGHHRLQSSEQIRLLPA